MKAYKGTWDKWSAGISLLCLLHCVVLPAFISTMSFARFEILENAVLELLLVVTGAVAGSFAIRKGYKKHSNLFILLLFTLGMAAMIAANFPAFVKAEIPMKITGVLFVVNAHILNFRYSRCREVVKLKPQS